MGAKTSSLMRTLETPHRLAARLVSPFYWHHPYRGNLPFSRADARGAVSLKDRFFYNRIPKVANSTIIKNLVQQSEQAHARPGDPVGARPNNFFPRPSKLSARDARRLSEEFFKFVFVRNPYSRVLSAYLDKIERDNPAPYRAWAARNRITSPSFATFCRYLDSGGLYEDAHWAPQCDAELSPEVGDGVNR